ncbi:hypothetical protein PYJP_11080 [Pyrofollis japonicus]|nr:hypothetical protein PYJP_11080 [Pyrofollis japonicus]
MIITNDAALFVFIPLVASFERILRLNLAWLYVLIALSVNVTSMMSPIGNPQNLYLWQYYGLSIHQFVLTLLPYTILSITLLLSYTLLMYSRLLAHRSNSSLDILPPPIKTEWKLALASLLSISALFVASHYGLQYLAFVLTIALISSADPRALKSLDLGLLAIFGLFFIDFGEISKLLAPYIRVPDSAVGLIALAVGLSQVISNVPATIMLAHLVQPKKWWALALGTNIGGTLLLTGSLVNLIVTRLSRLKANTYHKYAVPYSLALLLTLLCTTYLKTH